MAETASLVIDASGEGRRDGLEEPSKERRRTKTNRERARRNPTRRREKPSNDESRRIRDSRTSA